MKSLAKSIVLSYNTVSPTVRFEENFCQTGHEPGTIADEEYDDQGDFE